MTDASASEQDAYFASTRGAHAAPHEPETPQQVLARAAAARARETPELTYMRHTRNATVFIAVVVGIVCALSLIGAIVVGTQLSKMNSQLSQLGGGSTSSNCYSQGGTDLSC